MHQPVREAARGGTGEGEGQEVGKEQVHTDALSRPRGRACVRADA
jgi:hypothetical protein